MGLSVDTLRYYEKIKLLTGVKRTSSGQREYSEDNIQAVLFIRRAQKMGFSLDDISSLLSFRQKPRQSKPQIRQLAYEKLAEIDAQLLELMALRDELGSLTEACESIEGSCPILDNFNQE